MQVPDKARDEPPIQMSPLGARAIRLVETLAIAHAGNKNRAAGVLRESMFDLAPHTGLRSHEVNNALPGSNLAVGFGTQQAGRK